MLQWFFLAWHCVYCFISFTGSSLLCMVGIVLLPSLFHPYSALFVFFHFILLWFIIIFDGWYCCTSCIIVFSFLNMVCIFFTSLTCSLLLGMDCIFFISSFTGSLLLGSVCIVSLSLSVHHYWPDLHCFISCFIGSSLLGLYCFISITGSSYSSWFVLFHFILRWFIITEHGLYYFTSCLISPSLLIMVYIFFTLCFTGSSELEMVYIASLEDLLVHHYWALYCFTSCFTGSSSLLTLHIDLPVIITITVNTTYRSPRYCHNNC